jgi:hypothetical protein
MQMPAKMTLNSGICCSFDLICTNIQITALGVNSTLGFCSTASTIAELVTPDTAPVSSSHEGCSYLNWLLGSKLYLST